MKCYCNPPSIPGFTLSRKVTDTFNIMKSLVPASGKFMEDAVLDNIEKLLTRSYVKGVRRTIEIPETSIYSILKKTAADKGGNTAFSFFGRKFSYLELLEFVDSAASFLNSKGIGKGDRVNIMLPNIPQFVIMFYGLVKLGAVVVQTNPMYSTNELKNELIDSGSRTVITMADFASKAKPLYPDHLDRIIVVKPSDFLPAVIRSIYRISENRKLKQVGGSETGAMIFDAMEARPEVHEASLDPSSHPAVFQYTGGTTGIPKAAVLSHKNLVSNIYQITEWLPEKFTRSQTYLCAIPFFHVYGMMTAMLLPVFQGSEMILIADPRNTVQILKTIQKRKPEVFPGIPAMYHSVVNHAKSGKYDIGSIELCISGAAPLPQDVQEKFESSTGAIILEGYGLSEASPVTNINPADPVDLGSRRKLGSIGFPIPNTYERIVDQETGENDMPVGKVGELIIKGPQVMSGYWNNDRETSIALRNGWLYTGDLARMDKDGYVYIVDRKKDMIIASGYNIFPREVEEVLFKHPKISEAAVVGVKHEHRGETVKAFIVPMEGASLTEQEVKDFCVEYLAKYKIPKIIEFRKELPKTLVGKVLRRELRTENEESDRESE